MGGEQMTNMKKIITSFFIVTLLCYSNLSIKTNAQVNDSQSVTLLNDELEMQPGEIKTFTLYETTETTNETSLNQWFKELFSYPLDNIFVIEENIIGKLFGRQKYFTLLQVCNIHRYE